MDERRRFPADPLGLTLCWLLIFQVAGLFGDASIGNAINVVVVRLILLEQDEVKIAVIAK